MRVGFVETLTFPDPSGKSAGQEYVAVTLFEPRQEGNIWTVYVNTATDEVLETLDGVRAEAAEQYQKTYGTLNPALHARINEAKAEETLHDGQPLPPARLRRPRL